MAALSIRGPFFKCTVSCTAVICMASQLPMQDSSSKAALPHLLCDQYMKHRHVKMTNKHGPQQSEAFLQRQQIQEYLAPAHF